MASIKGADALMRRLEAIGEPQPFLRTLQIVTVAEAKRNVHRRTDHLGRNIVPGHVTRDSATVEARTPYAAAEEMGSRPHVIKPRKAKVLAWGGARRLSGTLRKGSKPEFFARLVHHPGTRPHPYLLPAARKAVSGLKGVVVRLWNDAA